MSENRKIAITLWIISVVLTIVAIGAGVVASQREAQIADLQEQLATCNSTSDKSILSGDFTLTYENRDLTFTVADARFFVDEMSRQKGYIEGYQQGVSDATSNITLPKVITVTQNVTVEKEVIKEVTRTQWRRFESLTEFETWLNKNLAVIWSPTGNNDAEDTDCDDHTERMISLAYKDGYIISEQLVLDGTLYGKYVGVLPDSVGGHIDGLVLIGNKYYYFACNPLNYRVIYICDRD